MQNIKKYFMTLALLLTAVTGAWAEEKMVTINSSTESSGAVTATGFYKIDNFLFVSNKTVTITTSEGVITKLVIKKYDGSFGDAFTEANVGVTPGTITYGSDEITVTDINAESVTLSRKGNANWSTSSVDVYYGAPTTFPFPITWDATNKTTGFSQPAGNVFMNVEYYPTAEFTDGGAPTGIADIKATTDDDIVKAGTVKNIGSSTTPQGTVMYYAMQSATAPTAPDYDATGWTDKVPTATDFAEGNVYVWYYIKGAEPASGTDRTDANTCSDSEITALGTTGYVTLAAPPTYAITMKEGTEEFDKWAISPAEATKGTTITATYSGERKVKSVKAVKKKAEPAAIINGKFSVSATKQVYFSKGNLRYVSGAWSFFDNQYDYYATYSADAWDKFGWSNSTNNFGMSTSTVNTDYQGDLVDWGTVPGIGSGWYTLSISEWGWLFNTRSASTVNSVADARYAKGKVNGVYGIILFPDTYTHPAGVTLPVGINEVGNAGWNGNNYSAADWTAMETAGCVFLPATGYRQGTSVQGAGESCSYRSSSRANDVSVKYVYFTSSDLKVNTTNYGYYGQCVRLVQDVK